jgi:predicted HTH domain antitoxin
MPQINFTVSEDFLISLNENAEELKYKMKLYTALHLFKEHKLSIGQAAEFACITKYEFMLTCGKYDIPVIDYDPSELTEEQKSFH